VCDICGKRNTRQSNIIYIKLLLGLATGRGKGGRRDDNIRLCVRGKARYGLN